MKPFEMTGRWWLPFSTEREKIPGILKFTHEEGLELNLIGTLYVFGSYRIILGETTEGKKITLCHSLTLFYGGSQKIHSSIAYIGAHFEKEEDINFNKVVFEYSHLSEWLQISGFIKKMARVPNIPKLEVSYDEPESLIVQIPKGKMIASCDVSNDSVSLDLANLEQTASIEVELFNNISLEDLRRELINPLRNLISLALDVKNCLTNLYVYNENVFISFKENERIPTAIQVYFRAEIPVKDNSIKTPQDRLFTLLDISGFKLTDKSLMRLKNLKVPYAVRKKLEKLKNQEFVNRDEFSKSLKKRIGDKDFDRCNYFIMNVSVDLQKAFNQVVLKWIELADEMQEVFKLFFSVLNKRSLDPETDFLKLAQAAEAFHRDKINNNVIPKPEFNKKVNAILNVIKLEHLKEWFENNSPLTPNEMTKWVKDNVRYNNEPTYRERIKELYELNKSIIAPLVATFKITDEALTNLKNEGIPVEVIDKLEKLKNRSLILRQDFTIILHELKEQGIIKQQQIKDFEELIRKQTYSIEDKDKFAKDVFYSRNYYTHNDKKIREKAAVNMELISLYTALLFMLRVCLMKQIGISEEKCEEFIRNNRKYIFAVNECEDKRIKNSWNN